MAGGAAPAPKADDPAPHPPKDQLPNVSYCITSPPPWRECLVFVKDFVFWLPPAYSLSFSPFCCLACQLIVRILLSMIFFFLILLL